MKRVVSPRSLQRLMDRHRRSGASIGFVPTMGNLHEGHASLIRASARRHDQTVVSIFVNPIQFNDRRDFQRYPRTPREDRRLTEAAGATVLFVPRLSDMYPDDRQTFVMVKKLTEPLCGASRPGHFRGVTTVVAKLLNIVRPDAMYLGQKDYQQTVVLKQMILDLNIPTRVTVLPIVREPNGLAMSSRNSRLTAQQREHASGICQALRTARQDILAGERLAAPVKRRLRSRLARIPGMRIDYVDIRDSRTLAPVTRLQRTVVIAVAVWMGDVRLIDNVLVKVV